LSLDIWWRDGISEMLNDLRAALGSEYVIIGNEPNVYYTEWLTGKIFENFPPFSAGLAGDYARATERYLELNNAGAESIIMSLADADPAEKWLHLAIVLLGNGWYCPGINRMENPCGDLHLGRPLGQAELDDDGFWKRSYQHGAVEVNLTTRECTIRQDN